MLDSATGRLVTLLDMLKFNASHYLRITTIAGLLSREIAGEEDSALIDSETMRFFETEISAARANAESIGLTSVMDQADRIITQLSTGATFGKVRPLFNDLELRIYDGLRRETLFHLSSREAAFYDQKHAFGEDVSTAFPSAVIDIEEAGSCLALGRSTACVLHLMRAMEIVVHAVAQSIGVNYEFRGWDPVIKKMRSELEKSYPQMTPAFENKKEFYSNVLDRLLATKDAIRNPTMHGRIHYDAERAEDVYRATRGFIQAVAKGLSEGKDDVAV
jgi:hypothetical protein